ncbi:GNAT family N-acetyltransferase [Streptomyces sp. NPDC057638]|uniref:GNAT family N-acetyltransferase n=1 Tax=Streptomyces sp. NPDC057638 TaxID=3346190 RepID=UPI0036C2786A
MTTELRVLRPDEWDPWFSNLELAFGGIQEAEEKRSLYRKHTEFERSLAVWDGTECVGTAGAFSFQVTVPGGQTVPMAGVTMVSVAATHRRRGILTSMMRRLLDDVRERGESVAILLASEPDIYGRFGYATATWQISAAIDTVRVRLTVPEGTDAVRVRRVSPAEAIEECEAVYARLVPDRPGTISRVPGWERFFTVDSAALQAGASPLQCVLAEVDGETVGYARYRNRPSWDDSGPTGTVELQDIAALTPVAYAALWRFLCSIDLTTTVKIGSRPVDDAWQQMVSDVRRCQVHTADGLHARLVDVGAALAARSYRVPVDVVFDVTDDFCPWNTGRWRLTADAKGAACERTEDPADLALTVRELGAAYLGGVTLTTLAAAGRVRELVPGSGALAEASLAFGGDAAPWVPHGF